MPYPTRPYLRPPVADPIESAEGEVATPPDTGEGADAEDYHDEEYEEEEDHAVPWMTAWSETGRPAAARRAERQALVLAVALAVAVHVSVGAVSFLFFGRHARRERPTLLVRWAALPNFLPPR